MQPSFVLHHWNNGCASSIPVRVIDMCLRLFIVFSCRVRCFMMAWIFIERSLTEVDSKEFWLTRYYWVFALCQSSGILQTREQNVS
jgi:hypothetical protein